MPKVSVYLPDELYRAARDEDLPISTLAQQAIEQALQVGRTNHWVRSVRSRPPRVQARIDTAAAVAEAREEFGA